MNYLTDLCRKTLSENAKNIRFWEDYVQNLKSLDFNTYADKLKVPIMVPVGSRILFRGELKHTNEITVALGSDYFVKCSVKQAEVLRQHRIKDAEEKLETFRKEREYLENQLTFKLENILEKKQGKEIIEDYSEEEDKAWREKHKQNVKKWKQEKTDDDASQNEITDEELWDRLEELELQEELENELIKEENRSSEKNMKVSFVTKEKSIFEDKTKDQQINIIADAVKSKEKESKSEQIKAVNLENKEKLPEIIASKAERKNELQKVIDRQNELEEKLLELKNKDRGISTTEMDLIAKLDDIEQLEEIEDEMERLEYIIDTEAITSEEELEEEVNEDSSGSDPKKKVYFADEDDSETLELVFYHSDVEPCKISYDPDKGIAKPSDIYEAFSNLFTETTSILKKSKYEDKNSDLQFSEIEKEEEKSFGCLKGPEEEDNTESRTIVVKDVVEKVDVNENKLDGVDKRPMSLFKQKRQQKKKK